MTMTSWNTSLQHVNTNILGSDHLYQLYRKSNLEVFIAFEIYNISNILSGKFSTMMLLEW